MKTAKKTSRKTTKATKAPKATPATKLFQGKIEATRLFSKPMPEFRNCEAICFMAINEKAGTVCYINSYNGSPRSSFKPESYTYPIKPKVVTKKMEEMQEQDVTDWPAFIENVAGKAAAAKKKAAKK